MAGIRELQGGEAGRQASRLPRLPQASGACVVAGDFQRPQGGQLQERRWVGVEGGGAQVHLQELQAGEGCYPRIYAKASVAGRVAALLADGQGAQAAASQLRQDSLSSGHVILAVVIPIYQKQQPAQCAALARQPGAQGGQMWRALQLRPESYGQLPGHGCVAQPTQATVGGRECYPACKGRASVIFLLIPACADAAYGASNASASKALLLHGVKVFPKMDHAQEEVVSQVAESRMCWLAGWLAQSHPGECSRLSAIQCLGRATCKPKRTLDVKLGGNDAAGIAASLLVLAEDEQVCNLLQ